MVLLYHYCRVGGPPKLYYIVGVCNIGAGGVGVFNTRAGDYATYRTCSVAV